MTYSRTVRYYLSIAVFFVSTLAISQNEYSSVINAQAKEMADATLAKDFSVLANYTYPKILDMMGGKEVMIETVSTIFSQMEAGGLLFNSITMGQPQKTYVAGSEIHCLLTQSISLKNTEGTMESESLLLCISSNEGKNWSFLDIGQMSKQDINTLFPEFNTALIIPTIEAPRFIPN